MPLWTIYHTSNAFSTPAERDAFAADITASYAALPPFYVVVTFEPLDESHIYRSGKRITADQQPFVRLVIHHLARHAADHPSSVEEGYELARTVVDRAIEEHIVAKNYGWEYTITEDSRDLWKIDGFVPPPFKSDAMEEWKKNDRAGPY